MNQRKCAIDAICNRDIEIAIAIEIRRSRLLWEGRKELATVVTIDGKLAVRSGAEAANTIARIDSQRAVAVYQKIGQPIGIEIAHLEYLGICAYKRGEDVVQRDEWSSKRPIAIAQRHCGSSIADKIDNIRMPIAV